MGAFSGPETEVKDLSERGDEGGRVAAESSYSSRQVVAEGKGMLEGRRPKEWNGGEYGVGAEVGGRLQWEDQRVEAGETKARGAQCGASVRIWGEGGQPPSEREGK